MYSTLLFFLGGILLFFLLGFALYKTTNYKAETIVAILASVAIIFTFLFALYKERTYSLPDTVRKDTNQVETELLHLNQTLSEQYPYSKQLLDEITGAYVAKSPPSDEEVFRMRQLCDRICLHLQKCYLSLNYKPQHILVDGASDYKAQRLKWFKEWVAPFLGSATFSTYFRSNTHRYYPSFVEFVRSSEGQRQ